MRSSSTRLAVYAGIFKSFKMLTGTIGALYMLEKNLSLADIALAQIFYTSTKLLLEFPAGYFADKYGRKISAILGCLLIACSYITFSIADKFMLFAVAQIIHAMGWCFMSGSIERWIAETARLENSFEENRINYLGHLRRETSALGSMITGPFGAFLASYFGFSLVYKFSGICFIVLAMLFFTIPAVRQRHYHYSIVAMKEVISFFSKNEYITSMYLIVSIALTLVYQVIYYFWQPLFLNIVKNSKTFDSLNIDFISFIGGGIFISNMVIYLCNRFLKNRILTISSTMIFNLAIVLSILGSLSFYILSSVKNSAIFAVFIFGATHGFLSLITSISDSQYFKHVESKWFSSIFSAIDTLESLSAVFFLFIIRLILKGYSVDKLFFFSSFIMLFILIFLILWNRHMKKKSIAPNE